MKLHLPSGLRKALLACLAALAVALPSTVATGAAFIGSGALVSFLLAQQGAAIDLDGDGIDDDDIMQLAVDESGFVPEIDWGTPRTITADNNNITTVGASDADSTNLYYRVGGGNFYLDGGEGYNLKLEKQGAGNVANLNTDTSGTSLRVSTLWVTSVAIEGSNNYFAINGANYLSETIQDIYLDKAAFRIYKSQTGMNANFHLRSAIWATNLVSRGHKDTVYGAELNNVSLWIQGGSAVETSGDFDIQEAVKIVLSGTSHITAKALSGNGELVLFADNASNYLKLAQGGANYTGRIHFYGNKDNTVKNVQLGDGSTLKVSGLGGYDAAFSVVAAEGSTDDPAATVIITGSNAANSCNNVAFGSGVLLELADGASQTFEGTTTLSSVSLGANSTLTLNGALKMAADTSFTLAGGSKLTLAGGLAEVATTASLQIGSSGGASELVFNNGSEVDVKCNFSVTSSDITLVKQGDGMLVFGEGNEKGNDKLYTINGDIDIKQGMVRFTGAADIAGDVKIADGAKLSFWKSYDHGSAVPEENRRRVVRGQVKGDGSLLVCDEAVDLLGGGKIGGNLITGWGEAVFRLGADLEVGGFGQEGGSAIKIEKSTMEGAANGAVNLVINTKEGNTIFADYVTLGTGVNLKKSGEGSLTVTKPNKLQGGIIVQEGTLMITAETISLQDVTLNGGVLELRGTGAHSLQDVTLNGGALELYGAGTHTLSSLTVNGAAILKLGINGVTENGSLLDVTGELTFGEEGSLVIDLGDVSSWTNADVHFKLFGDSHEGTDFLSKISIKYGNAAPGKRIVLSSTGYVLELAERSSLTWNGTDTSFDWDEVEDNRVWTPADGSDGGLVQFVEMADVTFNGSQAGGEVTVTVNSNVTASNISVQNGDFHFTGSGTVTSTGNLQFDGKKSSSNTSLVEGDYTLTFDEYLTVRGSLNVHADGYRKATYEGAKLVLKKGGSANGLWAGWGASIILGDDLAVQSINTADTAAKFSSFDAEEHYLVLGGNADITINTGNYTFAQFEDGSYQVGIKKVGVGKLVLSTDVNTDLVIDEGMVQFAGGNRDYTIAGNLIVKNATQIGTEVGSGFQIKMVSQKRAVVVGGSADITGVFVHWDNSLTLTKGGVVSGCYKIGYGASLHLGDDLVVGSFERSDTATLASTDGNIHYILISAGSGSLSSTYAGLNGNNNLFGGLGNSGANLTFNAIGYGVTGGIDLTITDDAAIVSHFKVKDSTVRFNADSTIAGQLALATGNVYLGTTLSAYSLSGAGTVQGSGKLTLSGYGSGDGVKTSDSSSATFGSDVNLRLQWVGGTQTLTSAFTGNDIEIARGTLVLTEGGTANGRILLQDRNTSGSTDPVGYLKLGKSLSVTCMEGVNQWSSDHIVDILSINDDDDITLTLTGAGHNTSEKCLYGAFTMGDATHRINLDKQGAYHQVFGFADVTFYGDIKVSAGKLRFTSDNATHTATIHGSLSSNATDDVVLALTTMKMAVTGKLQTDGSWSVGSVHHLDINSGTLILGGDLSVTTLTSGQDDTNKKDVSVTFANEDATEDIELISMTVTNGVDLGGTLTLSTGTHATAGKLTLTGGGTISGAVSLQDNTTLELGSGTTLNLSRLSGMGTNASISAANSGTATVVYTLASGHPVNSESTYEWNGNYTFGTGVALEIKGGDMVWNTRYSSSGVAASKYDIGGAITTLGSLTFNGQGSAEDSNLIYFRKGGSIGGNLSVAWGAHLYLGADLELSANSQLLSGGSDSKITKDATSTVVGDVFILFNVGSPESGNPTTVKKAFSDLFASTVSAITFSNVGVGKSGTNTLELSGSGSVGAAFKVAEGQVVFNGTSFELGGLTLAANTSVVVKAGTVDFGSAYSFGTGSSLEVNVAEDSTVLLTVAEDFGSAANLSLKLNTGLDYVTEGWSFDLFDLSDVTWTDQETFVAGILDALDEDTTDLLLRGLKYDLTVDDDGVGTISVVRDENAAPKGLVHVVGDEEDTFSWTSATPDDESWFENRDATDGTYFMNGDDATFYGEGNTVAVTVQDAGVEARALTLVEGVFTFSGGDLTLTSSLTVTSADAESTTPDAVFSNNVTLSSTGSAFTISGEGHVQFDHLKGNGSGLTIGTGTDHTTVTIKGVNGDQRLGGVGAIEVKAGSTLVLDPVAQNGNPTHFDPILGEGSYNNDNYVWGGGTVVLAGATRFYSVSGTDTFLSRLLLGTDANVTTPTLDTLQIGTDTARMRFELSSNDDTLRAALRAAKNIVVHSGSTLTILDNNPLQYPGGIPAYSNTIHISGTGTGTAISGDSHEGKNAALSVIRNTTRIDFNIELDAAAAVYVHYADKVLWHKGYFIANGHKLTKLGNGIMEVNEIAGYNDEGNLSAADYEAGDVDVQGGVMRFCMSQDSTVAKHVSLGDGTSLSLRGASQATGNIVYTVENLTGTGSVVVDHNSDRNPGDATLRIDTDKLAADRVDGTSTFTISDVGLTVSVNSSNDAVRTYKMGAGVTLTNLVRLGVEKGILVLRAGTGDEAKDHTVAGEINIASGATLQIADTAGDEITLTGATLSGSGSLLMKAGTLTLTGGGTSSVVVDIRNAATIALGDSLTIGGIDNGTWNGSGTANINLAATHADDVKLILNVGDGVTCTHAGSAIAERTKLVIDENITLDKQGAGKQTLHNLSAGKVQLTAGTLAFTGTSEVSSKLTAIEGTLEVTSGKLTLADYSGSLTKLTLGANATLTVKASTDSSAINLVGADLGRDSRLELGGYAMIAINSNFNTAVEGTNFVISLLDVADLDLTDDAVWQEWEYRLYAAGSGPEGGVVSLLDDTMLKHGQHFEDNDGLITITGAYIEHGDLEYRDADDFTWTEGDFTKRWWLQNPGITPELAYFLSGDNVHFYGDSDPDEPMDEVNVLVDGTVKVGDMKITVLNGATGYAFAADESEGSKTGDALNVLGDISLNMKKTGYANFDVEVRLSKADSSATTISGAGHIVFDDLTSASGIVIGNGTDATVVEMNVSGVTATATKRNLGTVEVKAGSSFVINAAGSGSNPFANTQVKGGGSLVINIPSSSGNAAVGVYPFHLVLDLLDRGANVPLVVGENSIHEVHITKGSGNAFGLHLGNADADTVRSFAAIENLYIGAGMTLRVGTELFNAISLTDAAGNTFTNTLHIAGDGLGQGTNVEGGAVRFMNSMKNMAWNIHLVENASIAAAVNANLTGAFIADGHDLIKLGANTLTINKLGGYAEDGSVNADDYVAGAVTVSAGTLLYKLAADATIATTMTANGTLTLTGSGASATAPRVYTVQDMRGTGSVGTAANSGAATLRIDTAKLTGDVNNEATFTLNGVGLAVSVNSNNATTRSYTISGATLTNLTSLSVEKGNLILKAGTTDATAKAHTVTGNISISSGATLQIADTAGDKITLTGATLSGAGTLLMKAGTLTLTGGGNFEGTVDIRNNAQIDLGDDLTIGGFDCHWSTLAGEVNGALAQQKIIASDSAEHTLTINVAGGTTASHQASTPSVTALVAEEGISLVKTGEGTQVFSNLKASDMLVQEGTLRWDVGSRDTQADYYVQQLTVSKNAENDHLGTLELAKKAWEVDAMTLTLEYGGVLALAANTPEEVTIGIGTLELVADDAAAAAGQISWSNTATGAQTLTFGKLTGTGVLKVADLFCSSTGNAYSNLVLESMENFSGTLLVNTAYSDVANERGVLFLGAKTLNTATLEALSTRGNFHQEEGYDAVINASTVVTHAFRKTGAGSLSLQNLQVNGLFYMNYEGSLSIAGDVHIKNNSTLFYTTADTRVVGWELSDWASQGYGQINIDIWGALAVDPGIMFEGGSGLCLGILSDTADESIFSTLMGTDGTNGRLHLRNAQEGSDFHYELSWEQWGDTDRYVLYLKVTGIERDNTLLWDKNWLTELAVAPDSDDMRRSQTTESDYANMTGGTGSFADHALVLGDDTTNRFTSGSQHRVRLVGGPSESETLATVIGGNLYTDDAPVRGTVDVADTYISLRAAEGGSLDDVHYHLLVGGSANASTTDVEGSGFKGNTHIQMEGGTVDYIVGGNHLNTSAFSFEGNSYISVGSGQVTGGIVGGSTLVAGRSDADRTYYEFHGNSYVFIYTALSGNTPTTISGGRTGFAAVVGGNAWIGMTGNAQELSPSFFGSSHITVDLTNPGVIPTGDAADAAGDAVSGLVFDKAIVGGNYTAYSDKVSGEASTLFEGRGTQRYASDIVITTGETGVTFTAGINGASRRDSAGAGTTLFEGDTNVTINGGTFTAEIAGGFWFGTGANGSHSSVLDGETNVTINGGNVWRVVGGSVSLGGAGSSSLAKGDTHVTITGGTFASKGALMNQSQGDVSFVAGGDFYKNTGTAEGHVREADTHVDIQGGVFTNVHLVGGDYVNFSDSEGEFGPEITGSTFVNVGVEGSSVSITGMVVGGSYLTDAGARGRVSIDASDTADEVATHLVIGENAVLHAESAVGGHKNHANVAVVAGHVLIDEGDLGTQGDHSVAITGSTSLEVQGGEIYGAVVGGSYSNDSDSGVNSLSISGGTSVKLSGGTIIGSVYGGHYSDNRDLGDTLSIGGQITVEMNGASVQGNIVGGSRRAVNTTALTAPVQDDIVIRLVSGVLEGNVYAAGQHTSNRLDGDLNVTTASTTVEIGADFVFGRVMNPETGVTGSTTSYTVSGGYAKAGASSLGSDLSKVDGEALLKFTDAVEYTHLDGVVYRDFDRVDLATSISMSSLTVMDRAGATAFTKSGSGTLTIADGVHLDGAAAADYSGGIAVAAGVLQVGADQAIGAAALSFGMDGRVSGNSDAAYLQAVNGATLSFDDDLVQAKAANSVTVTLTDVATGGLRVGTYYLASGLDEAQAALLLNDKEFFKAVGADGAELVYEEGFDGKVYVNRDGYLVLRVYQDRPNEWIWDGSDGANGNIWGGNTENWTKDGDDDSNEEKVVFDDGAENQDVLLGRTQSPDEVHVQSGHYTFANVDESVEGLDMTGRFIVGGKLAVEGDIPSGYLEATAALNDYNKQIGEVELRLNGELTLGHEASIQEVGNENNKDGTKIWFHGGKLVIAEEDGQAIFTKDVSWLVQEQDKEVEDQTPSAHNIRIQVGDKTADRVVARAVVEDGVPEVVYGSRVNATNGTVEYGTRQSNEFIKQMFANGIEKDGRGTLEVEWAEDRNVDLVDGSAEVLDGTMRYHLHGTGLVEERTVKLAAKDGLLLTRGASVEFVAEGRGVLEVAGSIVQVDGEVDGVSRIVLGSTEVQGRNSTQSTYRMSVDNGAFDGEIELRGDGKAIMGNQVELTSDAALGGKDTTLVLNGMHLSYSKSGAHTIAAAMVKVTEGSTTYVGGVKDGAANASISIASVVEGSGTLAIMDGLSFSHSITGDMSGFDGVLDTGTGVWTLKEAALSSGAVKAQLEGDGRVVIGDGKAASVVRLEGKVGGRGDSTVVENKLGATGRVVIVNADNSSNGTLAFNGNTIALGAETMLESDNDRMSYAGEDGRWNGGVLSGRSGTYSLVSGKSAEIVYKDGVSLEVNTARNAVVHAGGTQGSMFDSITIREGGQLQGVSGLIRGTGIELHLSDANMNDQDRYLIQMDAGSTGVTVNTLDDFSLIFTNKAFVSVLKTHRDPETELSYIHVVENGKLTFRPAVDLTELLAYDPNVGNNVLLSVLGFTVKQSDATRPGDLQLAGSSSNVYLVVDEGGDPDHVSDYGRMSGFLATVVDEDQTLDVTIGDLPNEVPAGAPNPDAYEKDIAAGGMLVNNLVGLGNSKLAAHKAADATGDVTLVLDNSIVDANAVDSPDEFKSRVGVDTAFEGSIVADAGVNVKKIGQGTLTVGSELDRTSGLRTEGDVRLENGGLELRGGSNKMGSLTFAYEKGSENKGLTLGSGSTTTVGSIVEENVGNRVRMEEGSKLVLTGSSELKGTSFGNAGTMDVHGKNASLTLDGSEGAGTMSGIDLDVTDGGSLTLKKGASKVGGKTHVSDGSIALEGASSITSEDDVWLEKNGRMSLSERSTLETDGELKMDAGSEMVLDGSSVVKARNGAVVNGTLDLGGSTGSELTGLSGSGTIAGNGASLALHGDNTWGGSLSGTGTLRVGQGESLYLDHLSEGSGWTLINEGSLTIDLTDARDCTSLAKLDMAKGSKNTLLVNTDQGRSMGGLDLGEIAWGKGAELMIRSTGTGTFYGDKLDLGVLAGELPTGSVLDVRMAGAALLHYESSGLYKGEDGHLYVGMATVRNNLFYMENMEKNPKAGADMFWDVSDPNSAAWRALTADPMTALVSDLYKTYAALADMVVEGREAELAKTLAAGAGASVSVLGSALSQDIQRQLSAIRTRTASMGGEQADGKPLYHVWLNAEGSYHKLDADGMAPGYTLNNWGGTVGVEFDVSSETTVGVALSAMYGDLKTDSADNGRGNMDTTYISGFARMARGAWMHTVVLSAGLADVDLNRTVSYGTGSYSTTGNTNGYAVGLLYELGYSQVMNSEGTMVLQPVFNVELRRSMINGYTESGSDAGLKVDDIEHNVITFGLGTRMQQVLSAQAVNRSAVFEARALIKADVGDRSGSADNRLIKGATTREVESAEVGSVGFEVGAGLHIPVGSSGNSIFMDASLEMRKGYTSMDANVGYRASF